MTIHDFDERLAYSHDQADAPFWQKVYRKAFPDMLICLDLRQDGWHQRAGRDRAIILTSGWSIFIDEKARSRSYGDILIEIWSRYPKNGEPPFMPVRGAKPGWAREPKDCDFLAYACVPTQVCYLIPFLGIRAAWNKYGGMWWRNAIGKKHGFRFSVAKNPTYNTISVVVPPAVLQANIADALTIRWTEET